MSANVMSSPRDAASQGLNIPHGEADINRDRQEMYDRELHKRQREHNTDPDESDILINELRQEMAVCSID